MLAILSILAAVAVPFAETAVERRKEAALRETLRDVRTAIDRFHDDWKADVFGDGADRVSDNGFPTDMQILVDGLSDGDGKTRRYLRRLPSNPFGTKGASVDDHWLFLGYTDAPDAQIWNGEDIYDIRPATEKTALDGSAVADW